MTARPIRARHAMFIGLGFAIAALAACAAPEISRSEAESKKATQASSVVVEMKDASGGSLGTCSGTLIGPKTVLTAGHCIAGASGWSVSGSAGSAKASSGATPWKNFQSDLSHPEHSDVGLLFLDEEIALDSYPAVASSPVKNGAKATRFHRAAENKEPVPTSSFISTGADKGFKLNYLTEPGDGERLDPGGAVLDSDGEIIGVVSGQGKTTKLLHIARVDGYSKWIKSGSTCGSATGVRAWGNNTSSGGGGGGYGGTPPQGGGGWWGSQPWGSSSGGYGGPPNGQRDGGPTVPGYDPNAPTGNPAPAPTTNSGNESGGACPGNPACEGNCGSPSTPDGACSGPTCGGCNGAEGCTDSNVDYGDCASCTAPAGSGPVVR